MAQPRSKIYGIGINDADYPITNCKIYAKWKDLVRRCYSPRFHAKNPTYIDCTLDKEWLQFSIFREWIASREWVGLELDKDILFEGNKLYSPNTCVMVSKTVNSFILERQNHRGEHHIGVDYHKSTGKFRAECSDPYKKRSRYLGLFDCPEEAHKVWKSRKHIYACQLADEQTDVRVAEVLRNKYK